MERRARFFVALGLYLAWLGALAALVTVESRRPPEATGRSAAP
jgi:hypothetical protein